MPATIRRSSMGLALVTLVGCASGTSTDDPQATNAGASNASTPCPISAFDPRGEAGPYSSFTEGPGGTSLHAVTCGAGPLTVVFLHGQPTSTWLWRSIAPSVGALPDVRAVAMDLPGFGRSTAPPGTPYGIETHEAAVAAFLDTLGPDPVVLVGHDWGSYLGMHWASLHPERVAGLVMMEAILPVGLTRPEASTELAARADSVVGTIWAMAGQSHSRPGLSDSAIADLALGEFLELGTLRELTPDEWDAYRHPFVEGDRTPIVALPREIPRERTLTAVRDYSTWLARTATPALFLYASPGVLGNADQREWVRTTLANVEIVDLGPGTHFLQEDHGPEIARTLVDWLARGTTVDR